MIFGEIETPKLSGLNEGHPVWRRCWDWIREWSPNRPLGIEKFEGDRFFANLHQYSTKSVEECKWESHQQTIDLQVVLIGGELVDFLPDAPLVQAGDYDAGKERFLYEAADSASRIHLSSGRFAVFWPGEPHRPQVRAPGAESVVKVVFKINQTLYDDWS